jgi:hypothetical protein
VEGTIDIMLDSPWEKKGGKKVGSLSISKDAPQERTDMNIGLEDLSGFKGKHALYFVFSSSVEGKSICELHDFVFVK